MPRPDRGRVYLAIFVAIFLYLVLPQSLGRFRIPLKSLHWKQKSHLARFKSPPPNCTEWLQSSPSNIIYSQAPENDATPSQASWLIDCLNTAQAQKTRESISHIQLDLESPTLDESDIDPLLELCSILPNLETVSWPHDHCEDQGVYDLMRLAREAGAAWTVTMNYDPVDPARLECKSDDITASISHGTGPGPSVVDIYKKLKTCPNIKSLDLSIEQGGCVLSNEDLRAFPLHPGDKFINLTHLTILGYDWANSEPQSWFSPKSLQTSAENWKSAMDWTQLHHLSIDLPPKHFLDIFTNHIRNLTTLSLLPQRGFWGDEETLCGNAQSTLDIRDAYTEFITTQPPLESLSIHGTGAHLDLHTILAQHGSTLQSLTLHEFENDCPDAPTHPNDTFPTGRPTLTPAQISTLSDLAPQLRHCLVIPSAREKHCRVPALATPALNTTSAHHIFHSLREMRAKKGGEPLTYLRLEAGDYDRTEGED
ncbi:uncharacterized protein KY384_001344 [Bacidia gigantensis]|uniref:uncharacterized protein n=1 Tax=Bacidia gigantensis TaxID=2732470 RepID=UPI001D0377FF|nr:uncharacterized protein KY384_001344 [Bacidia gigantensis]KAG8533604.1 hypothetical protein KY384_001344 [Bacidia gigantensis]